MRDVLTAYENADRPKRAFALTAVHRDPYRGLVDALAGKAEVTDDTDINCDVCFSYLVESDGLYVVRLSMVGRYAIFGRVNGATTEPVSSQVECSSDFERDVLRLLGTYDFQTLTESQLAEPVRLALPEIERPTLRNALFFPEE
ncbi:hypothetical protein ACFVTT_21065 [Streptomyces niveus]|uniref:hypothetical protein n=1 Tax=Streptomyces niveus TaxID=193462 RepID=UPI00341EBEF4